MIIIALLNFIMLLYPVHDTDARSVRYGDIKIRESNDVTFAKTRAWKKDPFYAPDLAVVKEASKGEETGCPECILSAILASDERSSAVINGVTVRTGDKIYDYEILEIQRSFVVMGRGKNTFRLELNR